PPIRKKSSRVDVLIEENEKRAAENRQNKDRISRRYASDKNFRYSSTKVQTENYREDFKSESSKYIVKRPRASSRNEDNLGYKRNEGTTSVPTKDPPQLKKWVPKRTISSSQLEKVHNESTDQAPRPHRP